MTKWVFLVVLALAPSVALAQAPLLRPPAGVTKPDDSQDIPPLPDEMRTKMEIERADTEHKKLLDSAKELGQLSSDVEKAYKQSSKLTAQEFKKLGSIEKLAKKILSDCGGSEVNDKDPANDPPTIANAVARLSSTAAGVEKKITAETRFVVSYEVIADSNAVIHLAQYLRRQRQAD